MTTLRNPDLTQALSDEASRKTIRVSREFILNFYAAIRVARFHAQDNDAAQACLDRALDSLESVFALQETVEVIYYAKDFYVNEHRIKSTEATYALFDGFSKELQQREIGSFHFEEMPSREDVSTFIEVFTEMTPQGEENPFETFIERMFERGVTNLVFSKWAPHEHDNLPTIEKRTFIKQTYFRGIQVIRHMYQLARENRPLTLKSVKRIAQNFVDTIEDSDGSQTDLLLLLTGVKNWEGYFYNHAINTAIFALVTGKAIGMRRNDLRDLAVAAALSDIGNTRLPADLLDAGREYEEADWEMIHRHPLYAVAVLANLQEMDRVLFKTVNAALTHHKAIDGAGYPERMKTRRNLFGEIIAVCDRYDAMTTPRPFRPRPMTPPEALAWLARAAGHDLNPLVVKAFIHWMGALPAGTVVLLANGQIGIVVSGASQLRERDHIRIKVILDRDRSAGSGEVVEIAAGGGSDHGVADVLRAPNDELAKHHIGLALE